jgi:hypothetical protein
MVAQRRAASKTIRSLSCSKDRRGGYGRWLSLEGHTSRPR